MMTTFRLLDASLGETTFGLSGANPITTTFRLLNVSLGETTFGLPDANPMATTFGLSGAIKYNTIISYLILSSSKFDTNMHGLRR